MFTFLITVLCWIPDTVSGNVVGCDDGGYCRLNDDIILLEFGLDPVLSGTDS